MLQLLTSLLGWVCTSQGSKLLRAGFSLTAVFGVNPRVLAGVMMVVYVILAFH